MALPNCRFGCLESGLAKYGFDRGCVCFPDDAEQILCAQHYINSEPLGQMWLIEDYTDGVWPRWLEKHYGVTLSE